MVHFSPSTVTAALSSTKAAALTGSEVSPVAYPNEVNSVTPIRTSQCVYRKDEK